MVYFTRSNAPKPEAPVYAAPQGSGAHQLAQLQALQPEASLAL